MSLAHFQVTSHTIGSQHFREYPNATKSEGAVLQLAIKEYKPLNNLDPEPGSVTIIALHANGFPKETYEPLWDHLVGTSAYKIRAIWIADCSHQGASGVMNEDKLGDDPSWFDHSRDLLHMVNEFRDRMVQPIFGIGHSMGSAQLSARQPSPQLYNSDFTRVHLSLLHPRLLYSLVLIEPVIQNVAPKGPNAALFASFRNDLWPSREAAEASLKKNPMFKKFDRAVLNNYIKYGLREIPTTLYPIPNQSRLTGVSLGSSVPVTLTTTKHQEAWSYTRANFAPLPVDFSDFRERLISPELDPSAEGSHIFVRPETMLTFLRLPELRPSVLWVYGSHSPINVSPLRSDKLKVTGTGPGGSGGASQGKVREVVLQETGHMLPFEKVKECADLISGWIEKELRSYCADNKFYSGYVSGKSEKDMKVLSKQWLEAVRLKANVGRPAKANL